MKAVVDNAIPTLKPMQYGYWGKLCTKELRALTEWIALFTMSYEFADVETVCVSQSERSRFRDERSLNAHWAVAIGVAEPMYGKEPICHRSMAFKNYFNKETEKIQITSMMFGKLIMSSFYCTAQPSYIPIQAVYSRAVTDFGLVSIWPLPEKTVFRPFRVHDEDSAPLIIEAVSDAIDALRS